MPCLQLNQNLKGWLVPLKYPITYLGSEKSLFHKQCPPPCEGSKALWGVHHGYMEPGKDSYCVPSTPHAHQKPRLVLPDGTGGMQGKEEMKTSYFSWYNCAWGLKFILWTWTAISNSLGLISVQDLGGGDLQPTGKQGWECRIQYRQWQKVWAHFLSFEWRV